MAGVDMTWVRRAVELAEQNAAVGQLPFGAVVVRAGKELATGVNTALRDHDPAAHAEVEAVRNACRALGVLHLTGAVIYSSCEPCDYVSGRHHERRDPAPLYYAARGADIPDLHYPAPPVTGVLTARAHPGRRFVGRRSSATSHRWDQARPERAQLRPDRVARRDARLGGASRRTAGSPWRWSPITSR